MLVSDASTTIMQRKLNLTWGNTASYMYGGNIYVMICGVSNLLTGDSWNTTMSKKMRVLFHKFKKGKNIVQIIA